MQFALPGMIETLSYLPHRTSRAFNLFLQFGDTPIVLPVVQMLTGLTIKVLVPTAIGQMLRPFLKNAIAPYKKAFSIFNQLIVLMIILNAVSSSTERITQAGTAIIAVFVFYFLAAVLSYLLGAANGLPVRWQSYLNQIEEALEDLGLVACGQTPDEGVRLDRPGGAQQSSGQTRQRTSTGSH